MGRFVLFVELNFGISALTPHATLAAKSRRRAHIHQARPPLACWGRRS